MIIRSEEIYNKAKSIIRSCGTRDTLKIARELGIHVHYIDDFNELLGMYTYRYKERHILLNSKMEHMVMQMVCGHEIGHDTFHRGRAFAHFCAESIHDGCLEEGQEAVCHSVCCRD